jgi:hypothetical protein
MKYFLKLLEHLGRRRIIMDRLDNEPYLERYYVFLKDRTWFPFNIFLHKFLKSDPDVVHDHPWHYATLILKGGYWEWIPQFDKNGTRICEIAKWRRPGHFRVCHAHSLHRIEIDPNIETWTLFMPMWKKREWGFLTHRGWMPHNEYLNSRSTK